MTDVYSVNVKKSFAKKEIINNFSFAAPGGKITAVIGPNGCGKTTWIKIALGLLKADSGCVLFGAESIEKVRQRTAAVFDEPPVAGYLSGYDNLKVLSGCEFSKDKMIEISEALALSEQLLSSRAKGYSFGQRHKLSVAAAMLRNPEILFLDEPAVGLDIESWDRLKTLLKKQAGQGTCVIITGHNYDLIEEIADNAVFIKDKCIYKSGSAKEIVPEGYCLKDYYRLIYCEE